jgi:hypothetical protein
MSVPSVDAMIEGFIHPDITQHYGVPTYEAITDMQQQLSANAASVHTERGGGILGYVAITVSTEEYAIYSATPFTIPNNPGSIANVGGLNSDSELAEGIRAHKEALRQWKEYLTVDAALKKQLIGTFDPIYLQSKKHRLTGFATQTTKSLLQHLLQTYGTISPADLAINDTKFKSAFNDTEPIETLFAQIEDAAHFAAVTGSPYSANQILNNAIAIIQATGSYKDSCREWKHRVSTEKTWENLKLHFAQAHQEIREDNQINNSGYHGASMATNNTRAQINNVPEMTESLENLAAAALQE